MRFGQLRAKLKFVRSDKKILIEPYKARVQSQKVYPFYRRLTWKEIHQQTHLLLFRYWFNHEIQSLSRSICDTGSLALWAAMGQAKNLVSVPLSFSVW